MPKLKIRNEISSDKDIKKLVEETIREANMLPVPFAIGKNYIFRTITMINIGKLIAITGKFLTLDDASWIADAGRWEDCLTKPNGIIISEKFKKPVHINIDSIVDATEWELALPEKSISLKNNR
jgi:hypothetical protein